MNNALLAKLGLDLDGQIEGLVVAATKKTEVANLYAFRLTDSEGKNPKTVYVGKKSLDEGIVEENEKGDIVIAKGFETFEQNGKSMVRNKARANSLDTMKEVTW